MANIKISELVESDILVGDEILPIVQEGITKKVSVTQIVDKVDSYTKSQSDTLLSGKVDKVTGSSLVEDTKVTSYDNHLANTSNPHGVTASQVGAYSTSESDTLLLTKEDKSNKGIANGYAQLDSNAKLPNSIIPDSILGQIEFQSVYDFSGGLPTAIQKGQYWICSVAGNGYEVGDWAVYNGSSFDKIDNTDAVSSVAGRTGNVVLTKTDVGLNNVTNEAQEVLTNKKTDIEANKTSDTFFPSIKAVYDWAKGLFVSKVTSTDNAIVRFNGTTGEVQNSSVVIDDSGNLIAPTGIFTESRDENGPAGVVIDFPNYQGTDGRIISRDTNMAAYKNLQIAALNTLFVNGGFTRMIIDQGGNVGIGTYNPTSKLEVSRGLDIIPVVGKKSDSQLHLEIGGNGIVDTKSTLSMGWAVGRNYAPVSISAINKSASGSTYSDLAFFTRANTNDEAPTERMRINSAGNVLIGTTTDTGVDKLQVNGSIKGTSLKCGYFEFGSSNNEINGTTQCDIHYGYKGVNNHYFYTSSDTSGTNRKRIATISSTGMLVDGFTKLGSNAPAIKHKKLTGTTASTEGGTVSVSHGLNAAKIISINALVQYSTPGSLTMPGDTTPGYQFYCFTDATNINLRLHPTTSENILSKPFTVFITYEE